MAIHSRCNPLGLTVCSLVETAKLNGVEPYAYIADVLQRMVDGHSANRLDEQLPWIWKNQNPVNCK